MQPTKGDVRVVTVLTVLLAGAWTLLGRTMHAAETREAERRA